jgi:hypothetical protein
VDTDQLSAAGETDPRFPSGKWCGFFLQKLLPGRHRMELLLNFDAGVVSGEGRDWVGPFVMRGRYHVEDGKCYWTKSYLNKHDVSYQGFNEGKGIWGVWEMPAEEHPANRSGGFHIWPEGMPDPTQPELHEEADPPLTVTAIDELVEDGILISPR